MRSRPPLLALPILGLLSLAAACGGETEAAPPGGGAGPRTAAIAVETALVDRGSIGRDVTVSGVIEPIRTVGINSQLAGALLSVPIEAGDRVQAGQLLARIDDRELAAQEASAQATFNVAQTAYERARLLLERQVITLAEYERERTALAVAEAQLEQVRTRRRYASIVAPVAGIVLEKLIEEGDVVSPQSRLFTVGEVATLVVRVRVSELDVVALTAGDRVSVALDAYPGQLLSGVIRRILPAADPTTRLVPVEVALESSPIATPGFLARVTFPIGNRSDALLVPASAIRRTGDATAVFLARGDLAVERPVTVGATVQGRVEIVSGLQPGDTVLVAGNVGIQDSAPIRIVAGPGSAGAPTGPATTANGES